MKKFLIKGILADPQANEGFKNEKVFRIEPKTMELLVFLAAHAGQTVTKEEILQEVWKDTIVSDDSITRCISQLRKIFDDDSQNPDVIETIPKRGYRIKAPVTFVDGDLKTIKQNNMPAVRKKNLLVPLAAGIITAFVTFAALYGSGIRWSLGIAILITSFFAAYLVAKSLIRTR